ncbi:hypothetical protein LINPERHAP1_LOCUS38534 [Linum perenne]
MLPSSSLCPSPYPTGSSTSSSMQASSTSSTRRAGCGRLP